MTAHDKWTIPVINQGLELRAEGLTYEAIAVVLRRYHNLNVSGPSVRRTLRRWGAAPSPRGPWQGNLRQGTTETERAL